MTTTVRIEIPIRIRLGDNLERIREEEEQEEEEEKNYVEEGKNSNQ